jgi:hypothetical protein
MTALLLSLSLLLIPSPQEGKATWYGYTGDKITHCYQGHRNSCSPYLKRAQGGWHDEVLNYCAIPNFKYRQKPFWVVVENLRNGKTALCLVRDFCACTGGGIIDLSPAVFLKLTPSLGTGVLRVRVQRLDQFTRWRHL